MKQKLGVSPWRLDLGVDVVTADISTPADSVGFPACTIPGGTVCFTSTASGAAVTSLRKLQKNNREEMTKCCKRNWKSCSCAPCQWLHDDYKMIFFKLMLGLLSFLSSKDTKRHTNSHDTNLYKCSIVKCPRRLPLSP